MDSKGYFKALGVAVATSALALLGVLDGDAGSGSYPRERFIYECRANDNRDDACVGSPGTCCSTHTQAQRPRVLTSYYSAITKVVGAAQHRNRLAYLLKLDGPTRYR